MPTRYCESDRLASAAGKLFGEAPAGYARVKTVSDWIHDNVEYRTGSTGTTTTACDVFLQRAGVCRDFAHLGVTLCRSLNIPARMAVGYARFDSPPPDFHAVFEAFVGHRWELFDPTGMTDPQDGQHSLGLVEAMIGGLMRYDKTDLKSMGMSRHWHPAMMWYGPGGIGTSRGIGGFERHHQAPFLHAFPDRKGGTHRSRIAEGAYVASTGWPSVRATHRGDYLGVPASGRAIEMRVMDWWRCEGGLLAENWVFIDLPHLMLQMGVDLLDRIEHR